jgi:hypothetical protein
LLVVSEGDLLAEINKEEETFATRLDEALAKIAGARKKWEFVKNVNGSGSGPGVRENMDTVRVRAQDAFQDIAKARDIVQTVGREYRRIHRECVINQVTEVTRDKFGTFGNKIERTLGETPPSITPEEAGLVASGALAPKITFPAVDTRLETVLTPLTETRWAEAGAVANADVALLLIEQEIRSIRDALGELQNREKLKRMLTTVIEEKKRIQQELLQWKIRGSDELLKKSPAIGSVGAIFLTKGETKKIRQAINWRQYDKDDVVVKLVVTDKDKKPVSPDVFTVPAPLKLDFEKNNLDFEYDIKAGTAAGEYTITVTPEVGDPATVTVTVK